MMKRSYSARTAGHALRSLCHELLSTLFDKVDTLPILTLQRTRLVDGVVMPVDAESEAAHVREAHCSGSQVSDGPEMMRSPEL